MSASTKPFTLVVDDDPMILMDAHDILEDAGFCIHEANSGDDAMDLLEDHADEVALLFSDVEMLGKVNVFALARYVAEHWSEIEIVIASGRVRPQPDEMPDGATFINKPFSAQMVHDHLREKLPDDKQPEPLRNAV